MCTHYKCRREIHRKRGRTFVKLRHHDWKSNTQGTELQTKAGLPQSLLMKFLWSPGVPTKKAPLYPGVGVSSTLQEKAQALGVSVGGMETVEQGRLSRIVRHYMKSRALRGHVVLYMRHKNMFW